MKRILIGCAAALTVFAGAAGATQLPRASLQGMVCQQATNPLDRAVAVTAVMRPLTGTRAMELKFLLERRTSGSGAWTNVAGRDLGRWLHPTDPTLGQQPGDVWQLNKDVVNLPTARYRFLVTFRWLGRSGAVLGRVEKLSGVCDQP